MFETRDAVVLLTFIAVSLLLTGLPAWVLLAGAQMLRSISNKSTPGKIAKTSLAFWKKLLLGTLGGAMGEVVAISVYGPAESSWCREMSARGSHCDGQGPLILIFTIPICALLGSCVSTIWTAYSLRTPAQKTHASVFIYRGEKRALNVAVAITIQTVHWTVFAFAAYHLTLDMLVS
jgi:hypothetical protein